MSGILTRAKHRFAAVNTVGEAWDFIRRNVKVDLVFTEMVLEGDNGLALVTQLKSDPFLKLLPIVIYTEHADRDSVKRALGMQVQNFLMKPYRDEVIYAEIAKAGTNPWRNQHFEEEKSFCKMMGLAPAALHKMLDDLRVALEVDRAQLLRFRDMGAVQSAAELLTGLSGKAEAAGAWGVVECIAGINEKISDGNWAEVDQAVEALGFGSRLVFRHTNASLIPEDFLTKQEVNLEHEQREAARWFNAPAEGRCPVLSWPILQQQLDALPGCPVIDSTAASFQMSASGHPSSIAPLQDLVEKNPGLAVQMVIAANQVRKREETDPTPIEDPRLAVGLLGELRLATLARALVTSEERHMNVPPHFNWSQYWMFQIGTARMARFAARYMEFFTLEAPAYLAGLTHDIGKLLLLHLHPLGLQAVIRHSQEKQLPLAEAEKYFLGCTTHQMAAHFAEKNGLARPYVSVMRWIGTPAEATADRDLVAIVSLARDLCRQNRVGLCGDLPRDKGDPLAESAEWAMLRERVFPSFNLAEFEQKVHAECRELKMELYGRMTKAVVD